MGVGSALSIRNQSSNSTRSGQSKSKTILLLEQDQGLRKIISLTLHDQGMTVLAAPDPIGARNILREEKPDLFILEMDNMGETHGRLIDLYRQNGVKTQGAVLLMTTRRPSDAWRNLYQPDIVIYKPFDVRFMLRCVLELFKKDL